MDSETVINTASTNLTPAELIKSATIIDEGIKLCPLCTSEVRLFFINFNEKVLMCENTECDYPFNQDEVIYQKEDQEIQCYEEVASIKQTFTKSASQSVISTAAWSDLMKINRVNEAEELLDKSGTKNNKSKDKFVGKETEKDEVRTNLLKELKVIKDMEIQMSRDNDCIKNKRWVQNLMKLQKSSGMTLLKDEELKMFKKAEPDLGLGELKIDIGMGAETNMSTIKIEIANVNKDN